MMSHRSALLVVVLSAMVPRSSHAEPKLEQALLEINVARGGKVLVNQGLIVSVGKDAETTRGGNVRQLGIRCRATRENDGRLRAEVTALVAGAAVAEGNALVTRGKSSNLTLDGGRYTWMMVVNEVTPDLLERRRRERNAR